MGASSRVARLSWSQPLLALLILRWPCITRAFAGRFRCRPCDGVSICRPRPEIEQLTALATKRPESILYGINRRHAALRATNTLYACEW